MQEKMEYFSSNPNADAINRVRGGIADVKNVMIENIEKVLERGERFELLVNKTSQLGQEAFIFKKEARRLKQQMRWKVRRVKRVRIETKVIVIVEYEDDADHYRGVVRHRHHHSDLDLRYDFQLLIAATDRSSRDQQGDKDDVTSVSNDEGSYLMCVSQMKCDVTFGKRRARYVWIPWTEH